MEAASPAKTRTNISKKIAQLKSSDPLSIWNPELLKALHLLTRESKLNQDAARKLKQIHHLFFQLEPLLSKLSSQDEPLRIADLGAGKAYLVFLMAELFKQAEVDAHFVGVESRQDLMSTCENITSALALKNLEFVTSEISDFLPKEITMITALHACDTATDDALRLGIEHKVKGIILVPCCQAEISQQLNQAPRTHLWPLWRHGIFSREFGSHLTNVMRALLLEAYGYKVTVTEFTSWEHSLKNQLIIAEKHQTQNSMARKQLKELVDEFRVFPKQLESLYAAFNT